MLMAGQAGLGLLGSQAYRDAPWIRATWYANDWVTLVVAVPLLLGALRRRAGSPTAELLWCGGLAYAAYNYGYYLFGAALNAFFPLYVALVLVAVTLLVGALRRVDVAALRSGPRGRIAAKLAGGYFVVVAIVLTTVWLGMWAAYVFAGRPTPVEPEAFKLVAALDLTIMVPALAASGLLLWRGGPWGIILAPIAGVQATLYLLVLTVGSAVSMARHLVAAPGELPIWGTLLVLTAAATIVAFTSVPAPATRGSARDA